MNQISPDYVLNKSQIPQTEKFLLQSQLTPTIDTIRE